MQQEKLPYTLGLDIGIASVGWCVLGENRIVDLGVRCFDKAETAKEGDSLNLVRRSARLMRRRLRRRAWRLTKLARLLKRHGVIDDLRFFQPQHPYQHSLWQLRAEGLDRLLNAEEWARVIYHLCKHRGFHWISRAEEKQAEADSKGEGGKVKKGLADTRKRMEEKGYYASCNRSTGAINLWAHDRNRRVGKEGFIEGIGVKTAVAVEKFHVDTLGNVYPAPPEKRGGLA